MKLKVWLLLALVFCASQISFAQGTAVSGGALRNYTLGPGDTVSIKVFGEESLSIDEAAVDGDGKIQIPFFDQGIVAQCRTERDLTNEVRQLLTKYLKAPQVAVYVKQRNSRPPATIYGEVRQQQQVVLTREARLLELLSFAGGVTEQAGGMIQVFRTRKPICGEGGEEVIWEDNNNDKSAVPSRMYSLFSVQQGRDEANPVILPGDIIVVQKAAPVYITGEVNAPQGIYLKDGGLSLTEALAKIGGVRREAKTKDVKIYRLKANSKDREIISVNFDLIKKGEQKDVMLEPYDIVEVDKSKKSIAQIIFETVTGTAKTALTGLGTGLPQSVLY
ncbi:MAG TPA: polysaccharide biosynthesis/export family protein [Pyrinomonadaceae bacterium]|jgi:polysaccharide export outer membrane protein